MRDRRCIGGTSNRSAIVIGILALVVGLCAYFVYKHRAPVETSFDMARCLPKATLFASLIDLRGQVEPIAAKKAWEELLTALPAEPGFELGKDLDAMFKGPEGDLFQDWDGRAALGVWADAEGPSVVGLLGIKMPDRLSLWLQKKRGAAKPELVAGVEFFKMTPRFLVGQDDRFLYFADSRTSAELLIGAVAGGESLGATPRFQDATSHLQEATKGSLVSVYWDLEASITKLRGLGLPGMDRSTFRELACLQYGVVSLDWAAYRADGFLRVQAGDTTLGQKLLVKGTLNARSFKALSAKASSVGGVDLEWLYRVFLTLAQAFPGTREYAGYTSAGLAMAGDPFAAFEGDLTLASDPSESLARLEDEQTVARVDKASLHAPWAFSCTVKDQKRAERLLEKFLDKGVANAGKKQGSSYLLPGLGTLELRHGDPPRLLLALGGKGGEELFDTTSGTAADKAPFKEILAWGKDGVIYADYVDLGPLKHAIDKMDANKPEIVFVQSLSKLLDGRNLQGVSCLTTRSDGLQWTARGVSGWVVPLAGLASVIVPNFIRARAQGQLTACKSNLKNLGTAMEMYSADWSGHYPASFDKLIPNYLREIPSCPHAGVVTYKLYTGVKAKGNPGRVKDYYYIECAGENHTDVSIDPNFPAFSSMVGLIESTAELSKLTRSSVAP